MNILLTLPFRRRGSGVWVGVVKHSASLNNSRRLLRYLAGLDQETGDARGYWRTLIPLGLSGGALNHVSGDEDESDAMQSDEEGWKTEYTEWWIEFLEQSGAKGVSNDTWNMVSICFQFVPAIYLQT